MIGLLFMRRKGFEPSHPYGHMRLKHACLPFHHLRSNSIIPFFLKMPIVKTKYLSFFDIIIVLTLKE